MKQNETIVEYALGTFVQKIVDKIKQGWDIDPNNPASIYGFHHECGLVRDATNEQLESDAAELAKPSRAEILAKARAAKAAKSSE